MKRYLLAGGAAIALCSSLAIAQGAPESLLPPGFDEPAPTQSPTPAPTRTPSTPSAPSAQPTVSVPTVQPVPSAPSQPAVPAAPAGNLPSLSELEGMEPDELDELLGLKPKYDIPPAARRSMERVGLLDQSEGGLGSESLARQPASLVRAVLGGLTGQVVSRWGHILLRRTLASRLQSPEGMEPAEFLALRAAALNALGEFHVSRAVMQDADTSNWNDGVTDAALQAYIATGDITGSCPVVQLKGGEREDPQWLMLQSICYAYAGQGARSQANLNRAFRNEIAPRIDVLLAQRYAGAAGNGRRAINLEWDGVEELTPWRFSLANAVGAEIPENLLADAAPYYLKTGALTPAVSLLGRAQGIDLAGAQGILSSSAMIDYYSAVHAQEGSDGPVQLTAARLRDAYIGDDPKARLDAIRDVWGGEEPQFARYVLTAYAAARIVPADDLADDAPELIASMLTAGLDADALSWAPYVDQGSEGWALLSLAQPDRESPVTDGQLDSYVDADDSVGQRKSAFLLAGLAGLGRLENDVRADFSERLEVNLDRRTRWSVSIDRAAELGNPGLVSLLAGLGMQGNGWDKMTARHLFHIVSALDRVGLSAEARMIAAEAVARG